MNPKHQNPTYYREDSRGNTVEAVAPYNFVPLPEQVHQVDLPDSCYLDHYGKGGTHTGSIECSFTTKTPLYTRTAMTPLFYETWGEKIRDLMKDPTARHDYAEFFQLQQGQPVVPGSSLRGMIRTIVEIISNSKMKWVTNEPLVFRSVGDRTGLGEHYRNRLMTTSGNTLTPKMVAGYIEKEGHRWYIRPAQKIGGSTFARIHRDDLRKVERDLKRWHNCKNASHIWIQTGPLGVQKLQGGYRQLVYKQVTNQSATERAGFQAAVVARSGRMNNKRREAVIFPPDTDANRIEIDEDLLRRYREQVSKEQEDLLGTGGVLRNNQPVFYLLKEDGTLDFFGHAMMFRLPYIKSPLDFVPEPLQDDTVTDLAEALFGFVAENKHDQRQARAGRVAVTDAQVVEATEGIWLVDEPMIPKIMSGPKATSFQHYLTQQEPDTVDNGDRTRDGRPKTATILDHYASPPPHETVIRGHKLYWHKAGADEELIRESEEVNWQTDTQHTAIKPVKAEVRFSFRIHFENLRDFELGALLWALTLPGEEGQTYCHKIGMGKAWGMGSIHLSVDALHLSDRRARYQNLFDGDQWHTPETVQANGIGDYIAAFVERVTGQAGRALHADDRIHMLLKLLEYPGPAHERTKYMELGAFRERPVLPDPLHITQRLGRGLAFPLADTPKREEPIAVIAYSDAQKHVQGEEGQALVAQLQARLAGTAAVGDNRSSTKVEAKIPKSEDDFVRGAYIQVTVKDIQFNAINCDTGVPNMSATLIAERIVPPVADVYELQQRFTVGQSLNVWVLSINRKGRVQLTLRDPNG